jgi:hypothetical protein
MADIAAGAIAAKKDAPSYYLVQVAGIYAKLQKTEKALAVYGPGLAKKAVELVIPMAIMLEGFPTQQYESLVKQIKDAMAKDKGGEVKKQV